MNNPRENDLKRAHLLFLMINLVFSVLLVIRIVRSPSWELWFIPVIFLMIMTIWIIFFDNLFSLRARTFFIAGTSLIFLYYYGCHYEVFGFEFPLCMAFFVTACSALDENILTYTGFFGYFIVLFYHVITRKDVTIISGNYLAITIMLTVLFYSRFLIGKHSKELKFFDESIEHIDAERKSREDFLANVSHELRTPVNAIMGMADVLLQKDLDADVREEVRSIESAGYRLSNQIDDILDFSEIISGSLVDESESYFFRDLVRDFKSIRTGMINSGNTNVVWNIDSKIPSVLFGDKKKIRRVFYNIFKNALSCQNGGTVNVAVFARNEEYGINLTITVQDEGPGIKQEDINRAYYGRFEGSNENKRQEGLKLGLALSNGLIRFMDGFIMFNSVPGTGTTVTITVPQKVLDREYWKEDTVNADEDSRILDLSGHKILVVDDDYMNLNVAKKMLSAYGGETKTVDSGLSALELCKTEEFDLIFMDHMMPGMDGIDTFRAIKGHPASRNKDTPFIALTANTVSGARDMFLSEGFFDFVSKPIDRNALEHAIHRVIKDSTPKMESGVETPASTAIPGSSSDTATPEPATTPAETDTTTPATAEIPEPQADTSTPEPPANPTTPADTATPSDTDTPSASPDPSTDKMGFLASHGVNTTDALTYCAGSEEFYIMMLSDFGGQIGDKIAELSNYMEAGDEENYRIKIHALKSNTKTLGFDELSEMSRLSEFACKEGRFQEARDSHSGIMDKLRETEDLITKIK